MKRILFLATMVATLFASCQKENFAEPTIEATDDFTASFAETRTSLDGTAVVWSEDDLLTIFTKTSHNRKYQVKELSEDGRTATFGYVSFTGSNDAKITSNYALYPYDADATLTGGVVTTTLQPTQTYNGAYGNLGYALMAAQSATNNFSFRNAGSLLRFKVSKLVPDEFTLNSIKVASASNNIAGEATIDLNSAEAKAIVTSNGVKEITLTDINYEVTTEVKEFYVAMPSMSFADKDLTVTFVFEEGEKVFELPAFDLEQGKIKSVTYAINDADDFTGSTPDSGEIVPIAKPAANEIWYTTTDGEMAELAYAVTNNINPAPTQSYRDDIGCYVVTFSEECYGSSGLTNPCGFSLFDDNSKNKIKTLQFSNGDRLFDNFVNDVGAWKASEMTSLEEINIPDNVTYIRERLFSYLFDLKRVIIGSNVTSIEAGAFEGCRGITSITLPENLESIGSLVLWDTGIIELIIPDKVQTLYTGNVPRSVVSLTIGYSVTNLKEDVWTTRDLSVVYCKPTTPPDNLKFLFYEIDRDMTVYVPTNSVDAYRTILDQYDRVTVKEYDF
ncbi:MAG: leucine-rich repeat protein [Alistipes sp.]|nr:leucine-rich repeat protein [Alistipes sp.]